MGPQGGQPSCAAASRWNPYGRPAQPRRRSLSPSAVVPLQETISESCSLESYASSTLSDSLACSLSSSLADLAGQPSAMTCAAEAGRGPAGPMPPVELPQLPMHFLDVSDEAAPPVKARGQLVAPVPSRGQDSQSATRLLHASSSHFDALEEAAPRIQPVTAGSLAAALGIVSQALPVSPAGSPERCTPPNGPAPELILAALSASLAARKHQQEQRLMQQQQQQRAEVPVHPMAKAAAALAHGSAAPAGYACACCSAVFCDESTFHNHCASLEHAMAVLQQSMGGALPAMAAQAQAAGGALPCRGVCLGCLWGRCVWGVGGWVGVRGAV